VPTADLSAQSLALIRLFICIIAILHTCIRGQELQGRSGMEMPELTPSLYLLYRYYLAPIRLANADVLDKYY
jgi:hypothetical protein